MSFRRLRFDSYQACQRLSRKRSVWIGLLCFLSLIMIFSQSIIAYLASPGISLAGVTMSGYYKSKHSDPNLRHCPIDKFTTSSLLPLNRKANSEGNYIPKIIHQSWKNADIPEDNKASVEAWKTLHPDWEYILWDDKMNRDLILREFPWLLETYNKYNREIFRADLSRALYMYHYGGVYADLDMEPLKSFDDLIQNEKLLVGTMVTNNDWTYWHSIPNAIMASAKGHPFWMVHLHIIMQTALEDYNPYSVFYSGRAPEYMTGPVSLLRAVNCWEALMKIDPSIEPIKVLSSNTFYPFSWVHGVKTADLPCHLHVNFEKEKCFEALGIDATAGETYAITFWGHSWNKMIVSFTVHYMTLWGENIWIRDTNDEIYKMNWIGNGWWQTSVDLAVEKIFHYNYILTNSNEEEVRKDLLASPHELNLLFVSDPSISNMEIVDEWGVEDSIESYFNTRSLVSDFYEPIPLHDETPVFHPHHRSSSSRDLDLKSIDNYEDSDDFDEKLIKVRFEIVIPYFVPKDKHICVIGEIEELGIWESVNCLTLSPDECQRLIWKGTILIKKSSFPFQYKYIVTDMNNQNVHYWEEGENRVASFLRQEATSADIITLTSRAFRLPPHFWRTEKKMSVGTLLSKDSFLLGEILDVKNIIQFAQRVNLKSVKVFPIFVEGLPTHHAIKPRYLSLLALDPSESIMKKIEKERKNFRNSKHVDIKKVVSIKKQIVREIFEEKKEALHLASIDSDSAFAIFFLENSSWLKTYAAYALTDKNFCQMKSLHRESSFCRETYTKNIEKINSQVEGFFNKSNDSSDDFLYYAWLQYELHKQLAEVSKFANSLNIKLHFCALQCKDASADPVFASKHKAENNEVQKSVLSEPSSEPSPVINLQSKLKGVSRFDFLKIKDLSTNNNVKVDGSTQTIEATKEEDMVQSEKRKFKVCPFLKKEMNIKRTEEKKLKCTIS